MRTSMGRARQGRSMDIRTNEGLREALVRLQHTGDWDGMLGRQVLEQVTVRCFMAVRHVHSGSSAPSGDHRSHAHSLVSRTWEKLVGDPAWAVGADKPWGLVVTFIRDEARRERLMDTFGEGKVERVRDWTRRVQAQPPIRVGWPTDLDDAPVRQQPQARTHRWDAGLEALHEELMEAGAPSVSAAE